MLAHLVKPIKSSELLRVINSVLGLDQISTTELSPLERRRRKSAVLGGSLSPLKILLAEDNPVNQRVAVGILEKLGHHVVVANHGGEALAAMEYQRFDLVLMDVQMPIMDGFEATRMIRDRENGIDLHTPIVAMTAHAMKGDRERCINAGMDEYLSKPIRRDELLKVLSSIEPAEESLSRTFKNGHEKSVAVKTAKATDVQLSKEFDEVAVMALFDGDMDLFGEVVNLFLTDGAKLVEDARKALANGDLEGVKRAAHSLKGATGYLGGGPSENAAKRLEKIAASGSLVEATPVFDELEKAVGRLSEALLARMSENYVDHSLTKAGV
jgi:CheY-like chemotaxis protein